MSEPTHFEKVADYVMSNDGSELSMVKAERDYALHCLEREIAIGEQDRARIEQLEAALRPFVRHYATWMERLSDDDQMSIYPRHTYGELRAARAALDQSSPPKAST